MPTVAAGLDWIEEADRDAADYARPLAAHMPPVRAAAGTYHHAALPPEDAVSRYSHDDWTARKTGKRAKTGPWVAGRIRQQELYRQSQDLCDKLRTARRPLDLYARRDAQVTTISGVTRQVGILTTSIFRDDQFIPAVAVEKARPRLNQLGAFIQSRRASHPAGQTRYMVLTSGLPVPAFAPGGLAERFRAFVRRISQLAAHARVVTDGNIRLQCSSIEYTRKQREGDAHHSYHVHSNVVVTVDNFAPEEWAAFVEFAKDFMGAHLSDCGEIKDVARIIRYVCKPADLYTAHADEVRWLYDECRMAKFFSSFNDFRGFRKGVRLSNRKAVVDGREFALVGKSTSLSHGHVDVDADEEAREAAEERRIVAEDHQPARPLKRQDGGRAPATSNHLLGWTAPIAMATPWREPVALVRRYDPADIESYDRLLEELGPGHQSATRLWNQAGAPEPWLALEFAARASGVLTVIDDVEARAEMAAALDDEADELQGPRVPGHLTVIPDGAKATIVHYSGLTVSEQQDDKQTGEDLNSADDHQAEPESSFWCRVDRETGEIVEIPAEEAAGLPDVWLIPAVGGIQHNLYVPGPTNQVAVLPASALIPRHLRPSVPPTAHVESVLATVIPLPARPRRAPYFTEEVLDEIYREAA
ncbi:hypothetical protein AAC691_12845 [Nguyenibacter vanlangensis]|uniref:Replication protein n=1 Tax=Nguyenibacter vanlangensis TaxID=1216886 RepID=A0ABZ3D0C6_9PROT